jgi:hypothetical protein
MSAITERQVVVFYLLNDKESCVLYKTVTYNGLSTLTEKMKKKCDCEEICFFLCDSPKQFCNRLRQCFRHLNKTKKIRGCTVSSKYLTTGSSMSLETFIEFLNCIHKNEMTKIREMEAKIEKDYNLRLQAMYEFISEEKHKRFRLRHL